MVPGHGKSDAKWGASVARCPPDRAYLVLGSEGHTVIVGTYKWPDNGGTMPGKKCGFTTHVDPISPP